MDPNTVVEAILSNLDGVRRAGGGWVAKCPAHEDQHQSLSIGNGENGGAVVNCHTGCATPDVMKAMGLAMSDLFDEQARSAGRPARSSITETYDYLDEDGKLRFQVVRRHPKRFFQRRPVGDGQWVNDLKGVKRLLYNIPEISLCGPRDRIFVVEGEKDVNRLATLGLVATTSPGGAGKWGGADDSILHGRPVAILPDNDEAGEKHAQHVAARLAPHCPDIRVVRLPGLETRGDVSDWLDAGGTPEKLMALVEATPAFVPQGATDELSAGDAGIWNYRVVEGDARSRKQARIPLTIAEIRDRMIELTDGWPRRCSGALFVPAPNRVDWLERPAALFAYLHAIAGKGGVRWSQIEGAVTKPEFFQELLRTTRRYESVELYPHIPEMPQTYYVPRKTVDAPRDALDELVHRFTPETDADREFIRAAFITPMWGGASGTRPGSAIDSNAGDCGRGVGKTTLAQCVGELYGGHFLLGVAEDREKLLKRLLTPTARTKRIAIIDNAKGYLSNADIEGLITSKTLSGYANYIGEAERPNTLTWFITANGVELSKDLAQRMIVVRLALPTYDPDWRDRTFDLIDRRREEVFADIREILTARLPKLTRFSRWSGWEARVLAAMRDPGSLQDLIEQRQDVADTEKDLFETLVDYFRYKIGESGYLIGANTHLRIPSGIAARWYLYATDELCHPRHAARRLKNACHGHWELRQDPSRTHGRCFLFAGSGDATIGEAVMFHPRESTDV